MHNIRIIVKFLSLTLAFYLAILVFTSNIDLDGYYYFVTHIRRIADAMLLAIPALFIDRKRWLFPYIILVNLYFISNALYYRNYGTLMPLSSYLLVENLNGLGPSIWGSFRWRDLLLFCPSLAFMVGYTLMFSKRILIPFRKRLTINAAALLLIVAAISPSYIIHPSTGPGHPDRIFTHETMRAYKQLGFINYWIFQLSRIKSCSPEEQSYADKFMEEHILNQSLTPVVQSHNKNLIIIIAESMCSWVIDTEIDGIEITPSINALIKDDNALCFKKVLPQIKGGRSSDAQLLINTGLLPINSGAVSSLYAHHTYPSIADAIGYNSASFVFDDKEYWNQGVTCISFGFDKLYDNLRDSPDSPWLVADEQIFRHALPIIKNMQEPFYAQLVTLSGHYALDNDFESELRKKEFKSNTAKNAAIIYEYTDRYIGEFIEQLKECGLYDKSIIIIVGDHDAMDSSLSAFEGREKQELEDRFVPFIILNSPVKAETDKVIGQSDIYPSLLDIMGVENYYFRGLGESVFRNQSDCAVYHTGEVAGNCTNESIINYKKELWNLSDILIRMDYFSGSAQLH